MPEGRLEAQFSQGRLQLLAAAVHRQHMHVEFLPWRIDLQLRHLIDHEGLQDHITRVGRVVWEQSKELTITPRP